MKNISLFKGYYDWVAGKYGSGLTTQKGHFVIGSEI